MKRIIQIFIMFTALMLSACQSETDKNSTMEENPAVTEAQTTLDAQITEKTMENVDMQITEELDTTKPEQEVLFVYSVTGDDYKSNSVWVIDVEGKCCDANVEIKDLLSQEDWYDLLINNLDDEIKSMVTGEQLDVMYDFINQGVYGGLVKSIYDIKDYPGISIWFIEGLAETWNCLSWHHLVITVNAAVRRRQENSSNGFRKLGDLRLRGHLLKMYMEKSRNR